MEKNIITESVKQYAAAQYGSNIKSFDLSLVTDFGAPQNLPDYIGGIGSTIEEAFEDLLNEDDFTVQVFEDSDSLKYYNLAWNGYDEQGYDVEDGYFRLTESFPYLCNSYLKGKCEMKDIFAGGIEDFKFMDAFPSSRVPQEIFGCVVPELLEEV